MNTENADKMITFFTRLMSAIAQWCMTEPIVYFTAIFLGIGVLGLVYKIWHIR